nr:PREDICTED: uncharacterized protein LOC108221380 [Daucus carota subsp. sativus]
MAHLGVTRRSRVLLKLQVNIMIIKFFVIFVPWYLMGITLLSESYFRKRTRDKMIHRLANLNSLIKDSDIGCINELRMNRSTFNVLCEMLRDIGDLRETKRTSLNETIAIFLYILAHHKKNRTIENYFVRSGETISRQFNRCLLAVLKLHVHLLKKPSPITEGCKDRRWKYFKNCLGALDGTYVSVQVPSKDRERYRTRKGHLAMNVLGVCSPDMQFIYVLPGWEGSTHDGCVLRDAISRPHGLRIPQGCYHLVDAGYANSDGFLAPYRGQRYHLNEWKEGRVPRSSEEYFNMRHSKAKNVVERCFGVLKGSWGILRSPSFYPIRTQEINLLWGCTMSGEIEVRSQMARFMSLLFSYSAIKIVSFLIAFNMHYLKQW